MEKHFREKFGTKLEYPIIKPEVIIMLTYESPKVEWKQFHSDDRRREIDKPVWQ